MSVEYGLKKVIGRLGFESLVFRQTYRDVVYRGVSSIVLVRKGHVEYVEIFVQHVFYRIIVILRIVIGMALLEIGEKSFFICQLGGVFRIYSRASVGVRAVLFRVVRFLAMIAGGFRVEFASFRRVVTKTPS